MKILSGLITILYNIALLYFLKLLDNPIIFMVSIIACVGISITLILTAKDQKQKDIGYGILGGTVVTIIFIILLMSWILKTQFK